MISLKAGNDFLARVEKTGRAVWVTEIVHYSGCAPHVHVYVIYVHTLNKVRQDDILKIKDLRRF